MIRVATQPPRKPLWFIVGVLLILAVSGVARAQDAPGTVPCEEQAAGAEGEPSPVAMMLEGVAGFWFTRPSTLFVLCQVEHLQIRNREIRVVDRELAAWAQQVEFVQAQVELAVEARDHFEGVVVAAERRAREAEESADSWTRSPVLWMSVGAVVAAVLFAGAIAALDSIRE